MPLPTSGSYSLVVATITTSTTQPSLQGPHDVTFGAGTFTTSGKTYTYNKVWGVQGSDIVILRLSTGAYMLFSDPNGYTSGISLKYNSSTSPTTWTINYNNPMLENATLYEGNDNFIPHYESKPPCFLPGAEIRAGNKIIAIENIRIGDEIDVFGHDGVHSRKVVWVGKSHMTVKTGCRPSTAGYPICIVQGAIADNVPYRDMRVTPEHCMFFEGKFFPVRMLVNDRTIYYDRDYASYDYYHVELEQHSVIMADGTLTESYLSTGHASFSRNESNREKSWCHDAAFPLDTSRDFVEPIFRRLEKRAEVLGVAPQPSIIEKARETQTFIETSCGKVIMPLRRSGNRVVFQIPESVTELTLRSDSARPCDTIGAYVDDRRELGLLVGGLELYDADGTRQIDLATIDSMPCGWHSSESSETRWTDGAGQLSLPERSGSGAALLSVEILATGARPSAQS